MINNYLALFLVCSLPMFAQEYSVFVGTITDDLGVVSGAHIINKTTNTATYSLNDGSFSISSKENDTILISYVGYKTKTIILNKTHFGIKKSEFKLSKDVVELNEIELKRHNLLGSLALDVKQTPEDYKAKALKNTMDFSNVDMKAKTKDDHIDKFVRPHIVETDPTKKLSLGAGAKIGMPFKYSERLWALRKELAFKESFPEKLLHEFGEEFFFQKLKIPVDKYTQFIDYCSFLNIENLYKQNKKLEIIKIFTLEHKKFLESIKSN